MRARLAVAGCLLLLLTTGGLTSGCAGSLPTPSAADPVAARSGHALRSARPSPSASAADPLRIIVIPAAEQASNGTDDPPLTPAGSARARRLASALAVDRGVAVFVNQFQRTQSTGLPTATVWNVAPSLYDATQPAAALAATVRAEYRGGTVLIVGQPDTVPRIVGALCGCSAAPLSSHDHSTLFRIEFGSSGAPAAVQREPTS